MSLKVLFDKLQSSGLFSDINLHFADFLAGRCGGSAEVFIIAAFVSRAASEGHICIDLGDFQPVDDPIPEYLPAGLLDSRLWGQVLLESGAAVEPGGLAPLVFEKPSRLYLFRYWQYEKDLADRLAARARHRPDPEELHLSPDALDKSLQGLSSSGIDWQRVAACTALLKRLCIISGGPGTGKTTVVGAIISLALSAGRSDHPRIALAAPTGKAAARLQEAVGNRLASEGVPARDIPEASTIHRLLGAVRGSPYFRHDAANPLPFDMVVVDEASMVDLALMAKLVRAVPDEAHLIILGDRDQLSSVEPGAVLGDLCSAEDMNRFTPSFIRASALFGRLPDHVAVAVDNEQAASPLLDCVVELRASHRFAEASGIGKVSRAVRLGNGQEALDLLEGGSIPDAAWRYLPTPERLSAALASRVMRFYGDIGTTGDPGPALNRFDRFRVLCALREGPYGVTALNRLIERVLSREGLIRPDNRWYRGRPILVTKNDYNLNLFNGDLGIILPDPSAGGRHRAFFRSVDGEVRSIAAAGLPEHETVYAMTVHKSQGAEFDEALIVLPDRPSPVLTRELIYTGLTRARSRVEIWGRPEVFVQGVGSRTRRASGLGYRLWGR